MTIHIATQLLSPLDKPFSEQKKHDKKYDAIFSLHRELLNSDGKWRRYRYLTEILEDTDDWWKIKVTLEVEVQG